MPSVNVKDLAAGAIFVFIGGFFLIGALNLDIGTAFKMGPGYFPLLLSGLLIAIGFVVMVQSLRTAPESIGAVPWRGLILILVAPIIFGIAIRSLGLAITLPITALVAALASRRIGLPKAIAVAAALSVFCIALFIYALRLPLPLFGSLIPR
jgi:hypothetical protein